LPSKSKKSNNKFWLNLFFSLYKKIDSKKYKLIEEITGITSESEIEEIQRYVKLLRLKSKHGDIFNGIRESVSIEEMKKEQNYQPMSKEEFYRLVDEINITEPLDDLLKMLD